MHDEGRRQREEQLTKLAAENPRTLYQMIYDLGAAYRRMGSLAEQTMIEQRNGDFFIPAAINTAFSVELLLKFWIVVSHPDSTYTEIRARGVDLHGHKSLDLWKRVAQKYRTGITAEYSMLTQAGSVLPDIPAVLAELGDDPFVKWRYPYEYTSYRELNLATLQNVADAMLRLGKGACRRLAQGERDHIV